MSNFFKRFLNSKGIVTIIAVLLCFSIVAIAYSYRVDKQINKVKIPVAKVRIDGREEITQDDITFVEVASSLLSSNVIRSEQLILGKYVDYNTFIPEGGMFYSSAVVEWKDMPDSAWSNIAENNTIISLDITEGSAYGNAIYPGDKIDLYVATRPSDENGKVLYSKFIEKIKVLAVKDENGNHIFKKTASTGRPTQIIFEVEDSVEVDKNLFLILMSASKLSNFEIIPVPRNAAYTASEGDAQISSQQIVDLIKRQSTMIMPDIVTNTNVQDTDKNNNSNNDSNNTNNSNNNSTSNNNTNNSNTNKTN